MIVEAIALLKDNYAYVIHDPATKTTAVVDPSEAAPVLKFLEHKGWKLDYVINTHHHWDHVGGNGELKAATGSEVVVSRYDLNRIEGASIGLSDQSRWSLGKATAEILSIPGHTLGHMALWFKEENVLFSGDTLFGLGCGRLFEGTAAQMWSSLQRLRALPSETRVFCGHEYTFAHTFFALTIEPENFELQERSRAIQAKHERGEATVPSLLGEELETNPFLRPQSEAIRKRLNMGEATDEAVFTEIRRLKDGFKAAVG